VSDQQWMQLALEQACEAGAAGEVPIGAVVVRDGQLLAAAQNSVIRMSDPSAHAEILAMRAAGHKLGNYRLGGCELYATIEPCAMCAGAMIHARLSRLVYGAADVKAGADGSVLRVVNHASLNHKMVVETGVMADEAATLLREFFAARR
jgi:tRNA(adenine34) deaminase